MLYKFNWVEASLWETREEEQLNLAVALWLRDQLFNQIDFFFISSSINSNLFLQSEFNLVSHSVENILFCTFNFTFLPYPMLIKLLKSCIDILINPILCIVNNSLFEGKFSEKLKSAIVSFKSINKAFFCCSQKN